MMEKPSSEKRRRKERRLVRVDTWKEEVVRGDGKKTGMKEEEEAVLLTKLRRYLIGKKRGMEIQYQYVGQVSRESHLPEGKGKLFRMYDHVSQGGNVDGFSDVYEGDFSSGKKTGKGKQVITSYSQSGTFKKTMDGDWEGDVFLGNVLVETSRPYFLCSIL